MYYWTHKRRISWRGRLLTAVMEFSISFLILVEWFYKKKRKHPTLDYKSAGATKLKVKNYAQSVEFIKTYFAKETLLSPSLIKHDCSSGLHTFLKITYRTRYPIERRIISDLGIHIAYIHQYAIWKPIKDLDLIRFSSSKGKWTVLFFLFRKPISRFRFSLAFNKSTEIARCQFHFI